MVNEFIKEVKERSSIVEVAALVGIRLNRANKALCPFHYENTPSFSISEKKQIFKCFGCGEKGDSITLVSKMLNIKPLKAAQYINDSLKLGLNFNSSAKSDFKSISKYKQKSLILEEFKKWENDTFILLSDYRRYLEKKNDDETAEMLSEVDYYLDIFTLGSNSEKLQFLKNNKKLIEKINKLRGNYIEQ